MPQLVHTLNSHIDLVHDDVTLLRYVYRPKVPAVESPRPYFHPLRTLSGHIVSGWRPHDHRWHHGLSMTCAHLSGHNFWGGPTYLRDRGYVNLDNHGQQQQVGWAETGLNQSARSDDEAQSFVIGQVYRWQTAQGEILMNEERIIEAVLSDGYYSLHFRSKLYGLSRDLVWGSPTTQGRKGAGYGGLFWRGPRDFSGGHILMSDGREGDGREGAELMGQTSPWLAYVGQHDETDDFSTLIFVDDNNNPRYPSPWFARNTTPMVCPYFAFYKELTQAVGEDLSLSYRIVIADGKWTREQIEAIV